MEPNLGVLVLYGLRSHEDNDKITWKHIVLIVGRVYYVLQEIKQFSNIVALDRRLVDPIDSQSSFLLSKTSVVSAAQSLNMTVFYVFLSNEFNGFATDYRSDPILQINSLIQEYEINGFLTDHPKTLYNFLNSK